MRAIFVIFILSSTPLLAAKHTIKLTFIDGYNSQRIVNEEVILTITELDYSETFVTDNAGSISFSFKSGDFIQYQFEFKSGDFEIQKRQRYFRNEQNADITFRVYPSEKYESRIEIEETKLMDQYEELYGDSICPLPNLPEGMNPLDNFIYDNLQLPMGYGDLGVEAHFNIEFMLGPDGKPYLITILESTDENLDMEAIRLIRAMPVWIIEDCEAQKYKRKMTIPLNIDLSM